ncbi:hypothetical protein Tco_1201570 [Tanacetum coccineum]
MKVYSKHIDWGQDTFYRDREAETEVAKESEDMTLSIMKEKLLSMLESEKAIVKDYTKLVVTDGMVDYVLKKYGNKWNTAFIDDKGKGKEAEHDHLKVNKDDKGKGNVLDIQNRLGKLEVDLARAIKAKQVDDHDDDLDTLDLENRINKLEEDFGRLLKTKKAKEVKLAKDAKEAKKEELKAKEAKKANEAELKAKEAKKQRRQN